MEYNPDIHHRRSIRLKGFDYSTPGAYFITICTHNRECILGNVVDDEMQLSKFGKVAHWHWQQLSQRYQNVEIDESIVMPNHLHGIIILLESSSDHRKSLSEIIRGFKTFSARQINSIRHQYGVPVWQRNYYERIIRTDKELQNVRQYIRNNPVNWNTDTQNSRRGGFCQPSSPPTINSKSNPPRLTDNISHSQDAEYGIEGRSHKS